MIRSLFFITALMLLLSSCDKPASASRQVLVTIAPQKEFVEKIAGPLVDVAVLVPPGANPHLYEPTPRQMSEACRSQIWFRIGEAFESKALPFFTSQTPQLAIVDTRQGISLICDSGCTHAHPSESDTHIWLSPRLVKIQVETICQALCQSYPEYSATFRANLAEYLSALDQLDREIVALTQPLRQKTILVSHPAFAYFCRDYGMEQLAFEQEGREPSPQALTRLLSTITEKKLSAVFTLLQYNNKGAELVADRLGLKLAQLDPYAPNYIENMLAITEQFSEYSR